MVHVTATKPIWLLDVDGVLNAVGTKPPKMTGHWKTWKQVGANGFGITYSPDLIARIKGFVDEGLVEVHWLTTWWNNIPDLPFADFHDYPVANTREEYLAQLDEWWKLPVAQRYHSQGRRLVWTDDDIPFVKDAVAWLQGKGHQVLAIAPKTMLGLSPKDLDRIEGFLRA